MFGLLLGRWNMQLKFEHLHTCWKLFKFVVKAVHMIIHLSVSIVIQCIWRKVWSSRSGLKPRSHHHDYLRLNIVDNLHIKSLTFWCTDCIQPRLTMFNPANGLQHDGTLVMGNRPQLMRWVVTIMSWQCETLFLCFILPTKRQWQSSMIDLKMNQSGPVVLKYYFICMHAFKVVCCSFIGLCVLILL